MCVLGPLGESGTIPNYLGTLGLPWGRKRFTMGDGEEGRGMCEYPVMDGMDTEQYHFGGTSTIGTKQAATYDGAKARYRDPVISNRAA